MILAWVLLCSPLTDIINTLNGFISEKHSTDDGCPGLEKHIKIFASPLCRVLATSRVSWITLIIILTPSPRHTTFVSGFRININESSSQPIYLFTAPASCLAMSSYVYTSELKEILRTLRGQDTAYQNIHKTGSNDTAQGWYSSNLGFYHPSHLTSTPHL